MIACSSTPAIEEEGGSDASTDADASKIDASSDAQKDTGKDSAQDTGVDTGGDASEEDAEVDAADAGPPIDGGQADMGPPDGSSLCNVNFGFGSISMQSCSSGENWTCGNDTYEVECYCPGAVCECRKNNQPVSKVQANGGCPNCGFVASQIANLCGFPY